MKSLLDISPDQIEQAYKQHGLTPSKGNHIPNLQGQCCGLGAFFKEFINICNGYSLCSAMEEAGYSHSLTAICSWTFGFDRALGGFPLTLTPPMERPDDLFIEHGYLTGVYCKIAFPAR